MRQNGTVSRYPPAAPAVTVTDLYAANPHGRAAAEAFTLRGSGRSAEKIGTMDPSLPTVRLDLWRADAVVLSSTC